ncbi:MAG: RpiB/LacA/LacB family sugar-phosphate isomerase [Planctomycetota bacterium]
MADDNPTPHQALHIVVACDHRGFNAKERVIGMLRDIGHDVDDLGCDGVAGCDYPDFAAPAARGVVAGKWDVAVLLDGCGIGMSIVANKIPGCRAACAHDEVTARIGREHNHANVLCIGCDLIGEQTLMSVIRTFLETAWGEGRHLRRITKIDALESADASVRSAAS